MSHRVGECVRAGQGVATGQATSIVLVDLGPLVRQVSIHFRDGCIQGALIVLLLIGGETLSRLLNDTRPLIGQTIHLILESILLIHRVVQLIILPLSCLRHPIMQAHVIRSAVDH